MVTRDPEFASLQESWNSLADAAAVRSVFLTHEWFSAAWAWRRHDAGLAILLARQEGELVGILPLIAVRGTSSGVRRLELLTVPDTQLCDLIARDSDAEAIGNAFAAELSARKDWDKLALDYLAPSGACSRWLLPALQRHRIRTVSMPMGRNLFVALNGTWEEYYRTRSRRLKKALNLAASRLARVGEVRIDWLEPNSEDEDSVRAALAEVIDISARSWKRSTGNSLGEAGPQAFIRALTDGAWRRGWLSVWTIRVDGRPLAMEYQLVWERSVHALRADFAEERDDLSPGSHLFRELLQALFGRRLARYYLGPGENEYKKRWSDEGEPIVRIRAYNRTLHGTLAYWRDEVVKPRARNVRDRLRRPRWGGDGAAAAGPESTT